jgi:quercetin dioxygenase-like cupin family protein
MGAGANIVEGARHPFMHRTDSLDYAVVLTGEIYMMTNEYEYLVKVGDVIVKQGTNHTWSNRCNEPCQIAFILIDAEKA